MSLVDPGVSPGTQATPSYGLPAGAPTFDGFKWFVANVMGVPDEAMPDDMVLQVAYDQAVALTYWGLATVPTPSGNQPYASQPIYPTPPTPGTPSLYAYAVYNLGCAMLLEFAQDDPNAEPPFNTFWNDLRTKLGIYSATYGMVNAAADQGTSEAMYIPEIIKGMTLLDLQLMKSPWGRMYLMIAGQWGTIWGLTI